MCVQLEQFERMANKARKWERHINYSTGLLSRYFFQMLSLSIERRMDERAECAEHVRSSQSNKHRKIEKKTSLSASDRCELQKGGMPDYIFQAYIFYVFVYLSFLRLPTMKFNLLHAARHAFVPALASKIHLVINENEWSLSPRVIHG